MNEEKINQLVGAVDLDESLLGEVVGGQSCPPAPTSAAAGCSTYTQVGCDFGTTPDWSCVPPGMVCP